MLKSQRKVTRLRVIIGIILLELIILFGINEVELINNDKSPFVGMYGDNLKEFVQARHLLQKKTHTFAKKYKSCSADEINDHIIVSFKGKKFDYNTDEEPEKINHGTAYSILYNDIGECRGYAAIGAEYWRACGYKAYVVVAQLKEKEKKKKNEQKKDGHAWVLVETKDGIQQYDYSMISQVHIPDDNNWLPIMEEKVIMSDGRLSKYKVQTKYTGGILKNLIKELKQEFAFNNIIRTQIKNVK